MNIYVCSTLAVWWDLEAMRVRFAFAGFSRVQSLGRCWSLIGMDQAPCTDRCHTLTRLDRVLSARAELTELTLAASNGEASSTNLGADPLRTLA